MLKYKYDWFSLIIPSIHKYASLKLMKKAKNYQPKRKLLHAKALLNSEKYKKKLPKAETMKFAVQNLRQRKKKSAINGFEKVASKCNKKQHKQWQRELDILWNTD